MWGNRKKLGPALPGCHLSPHCLSSGVQEGRERTAPSLSFSSSHLRRRSSTSAKRSASPRPRSAKRSKRSSPESALYSGHACSSAQSALNQLCSIRSSISPTSPSTEMPKSKRNRPVTLSKTKKKGREHKEAVAAAIKQTLDSYTSAYAFTFENMRNQRFKEFREQHKSSSRFVLGSNKVMQISLGRSVGDEAKPGIYKLSKFLGGNAGLMFTNLSKEEVLRLRLPKRS